MAVHFAYLQTLKSQLERFPALKWFPAAVVTIIATLLRLTSLNYPNALLFDEKWYVPDAYALSKTGFELRWNIAGATLPDGFDPKAWIPYIAGPQHATHPPLGKWLIWLGMSLFNPSDPTGWRLASAVTGSLMVVLIIAVAHRLFRSALFATLAGAFFAFDGHALALSHLALLDGILAFWVLLAAYFVLLDRDQRIRKYADTEHAGKLQLFRPWLWAAGLALGAATATKVSGFVYVLAFLVYLAVVNVRHQRLNPTLPRLSTAILQTVVDWAKVSFLVLGTYLAAFAGWFLSKGAYYRYWAEAHPAQGLEALLPASLRSLIAYQTDALLGAARITSSNDLASPAWTWPLQLHPMALWLDPVRNSAGDVVAVREIMTLGNPLLWWSACAALLVLIAAVVRRKGFVPAFILAGWIAGWGPWLLAGNRTVYHTYSIVFLPFMVLSVVYVLKVAREWLVSHEGLLRTFGRLLVPVFSAAVLLYAAYFMPLGMAWPLDIANYYHHMWLHAWRDLPGKPASDSTSALANLTGQNS